MIVSKLLFFVSLFTHCRANMERYIVGGNLASIDQFPHVVYLYIVSKEPQSCGGSILTQSIVMTAAHCLEDRNLDVTAYVGNSNVEEMLAGHTVLKLLRHERYSTKTLDHDIALCFTSPFHLGNHIQRVIIARNFNDVKMGKIAGWGTTDEITGAQSPFLKKIYQGVLSEESCADAGISLDTGMFCASTNTKNDHPSTGDSGSALVSSSGQQIGLVSFRNKKNKDIVVYTNVSYYYSWIQHVSQDLSCHHRKLN